MGIKEFLKPTISKIIIFLILAIPYNIQKECGGSEMIGAKISCIINFKFGIISLLFDSGIFGQYIFGLPLQYYILSVLASYLLSCTIVLVYNKITK